MTDDPAQEKGASPMHDPALEASPADPAVRDVLRTLLDSLPDAAWLIDRGRRILAANEEYRRTERLAGGRVTADGDKASRDGYAQDVLDVWDACYERAFAGESFTEELAFAAADGLHSAQVTFAPLGDGDGAQRLVVVTSRDTTQRTRAQAALADSEQLFRSITAASHDAIFVQAPGGRILAWNDAATRLYGIDEQTALSSPEGLGAMMHGLRDEGGRPVAVDDLPSRRTLATGEPCHDAVLSFEGDGAERWVSVSTSPLVREGESLPYAVVVTAADVTERHRHEETVRRLAAARDVGESVAHLGTFTIDFVSGATTRSPEVFRLFDLDPVEDPPADAAAADIRRTIETRVHPDDRKRVLCACDDFFAGGEASPVDFRVVHRDGTVRTIAARLSYGHGPGGPRSRVAGYFQDVTERLEQQRELERATQIWSAAEQAGIGSTILDLRSRRVSLTPGAVRLLGLPPGTSESGLDELLGLVDPADAEMLVRTFETARSTGETPTYEHDVTWPDGSRHAIRVSGAAERGESGDVVTLTGWLEDITGLRAAEEAASESYDLLREVFHRSTTGLALLDADGVFLTVNEAVCDLLGRPREEIVGHRTAEFIPEEDVAADLPSGEPLLQRHVDAHSARRRCVRPDGSVRWFDASSVLREPADGREVRVIASIVDVTDQVAADADVARLRALRDKSESVAHVGSISLDLRTQKVVWSPEVYRLFDLTPEEAGPDFSAAVPRIHPDDRAAVLSAYERLSAGEETPPLEHRVVWRDGTEHVLRQEATVARDESGAPLAVTGYAQDVTEEHRLQAELAAANAGLEQRVAERTEELRERTRQLEESGARLRDVNRELESFSYSVSHDLRAPLRAIDGFSQVLLEDYGQVLDAQGREDLGRVRAAAQRMGVLIDDLLSLSRLGRRALELEEVDVSGAAARHVEELRASSPERRVKVAIEPGCRALADRSLLDALLANLLGNAWKFTSRRAEAHIEVGMRRADGEAAFFVRDDGAGFDPACADKLFAPFQRLHSEDEFAGTGIGLATVQRIVARHGGRVWAEGAVGEGATFWFTLGAPD